MSKRYDASGFALPTVVVLSMVALIVVTSMLVFASITFKTTPKDHYQILADEAAEAGVAYATSCLALSSHVQTWGPSASAPDLKPQTDCNGATAYATNQYVYSDSKVRTYFVVGNLDFTVQFSAQISASGYAETLRSDGTVAKTYRSILKKVITWPTDFTGQTSASGTNRTCAVMSGSLYCWGYNAYGQLGNGQYLGTGDIEEASSVDSLVPVKVFQAPGVLAGKTIVKVFVAQYHSCALSSDGNMYCWGFNGQGQLGDNTTINRPTPVKVGGALTGKVVTDIGGTQNTSCAIAAGKIYCWGQNSAGQAGVGYLSGTVTTPTLVNATNTPKTLASGYVATMLSTSGSRSGTQCAVADGNAYCWGNNTIGSAGDGTSGSGNDKKTTPVKVDNSGVLAGKTITSISQDGYVSTGSGGYAHVCVVADNKVYCWGDNTNGQLGDGTKTHSAVPIAVTTAGLLNGRTIQDVKVGLRHTCVLSSGAVYCWGLGADGQLGNSSTAQQLLPVQTTQETGKLNGSNVLSISAGANRSCAIITDGRSFCWGKNSAGQIGDGTLINRSKPTESLFLRPSGNQYIY